MSQFRVEKRRAEAEVTLASGESRRGCFFLSSSSAVHAGPERVKDVLNFESGFFPFETADPALRARLSTLYIQEMAKRGCHGYTSFYLNGAQGERELEQTVAAARETFILMRDGLARGNLDQLLECDLQQDAFRRLVR